MNNIDYYIDTLIVKNNPIYYNPIMGKKCTKEEYEKSYNSATDMYDNSKVGFKGTDTNGCMKWYKYSVNLDGSVNMILDHNTSVGVKWSNKSNNNQKANNALKVMNGLLEDGKIGDTTHWSDKLIRNDKYKATWKQGVDEEYITTEIDYTGYKSRLITAQEVADITHASYEEPNGIGFIESEFNKQIYLDGNWQQQVIEDTNISAYSWLFDNTYNCVLYGCLIQQNIPDNWGYWTSTPTALSNNNAWAIHSGGDLNNIGTDRTRNGVRPVITIFE